MKKRITVLRTLLIDRGLSIEALDGKRTITGAEDVFRSHLDPDFEKWGLNKEGKMTKKIGIQSYEIVENAIFSEMFGSLFGGLDSLCFTQSQIVRLCEKYPGHLRQNGYSTFFLFKEDEEYCVARVFARTNGLSIRVNRLKLNRVWEADSLHRLIIPVAIINAA